ncbi:hypothetical protein L226DRAFT_575565 [Lentinus tigrinus ALCF2SS1-7]|uniref:Uncharacterized protein n=1 Tax=Lentinus tigrinus ALCF2SS1-6 TaxID=1328759 RepID=A0A5C2SAM2_9APHY|nr:hypothetical protein L227DRAFT_98112 [Lentinus tigrinus ALCF2SS1-6]RPD69578.1 hypothetical protein L226DRAFT_575565 [Lentinus tigrinus ALCF2SS1-7]
MRRRRPRAGKKRVQWAKDLVTDVFKYDWESPPSPEWYEDRSLPPSRPFSPIVLGRPASPRIATMPFPPMNSPMSPMQPFPIPVPVPIGLPIHGNIVHFTEVWDVRRYSSPPSLPADLRDAPAVYGCFPATSFRLFFFPPIGSPFHVEIPMVTTSSPSPFMYTPIPTVPRWVSVGEVLDYIHAALYRRITLPWGLALSAAREARGHRSISRDEDVWLNTIRNVDLFPALTALPGVQTWATPSLYFIGLESWMTSEGFQFVVLFAPLPRPR